MKLSLNGIRLKNDWSVNYYRVASAYEGVLEGKPGQWLNDRMLRSCKGEIKRDIGIPVEEINVVPRYVTPEGEYPVLKHIKVFTFLMNYTGDEKCTTIATFLDEQEELENVLNEILDDPSLIIKDYNW